MNPQTREQIDSVLGWFGYSLGYTEQHAQTTVDGPALPDVRARQYRPSDEAPKPLPRSTYSVRDFAEGLLVCARFSARLAIATYHYAGQRLEDLRDPERARRNGPYDVPRPTLRTSLDAGLERVLDALETRVQALDLETRVQALNPMSALRRARTALVEKASVVDLRIARIWWPDKERDEEMDVIASQPIAPPKPAQTAEVHPVRLTSRPEPVARPSTETRGNIFDAAAVEAVPPPSEPTAVIVQSPNVSEVPDPPAASSTSSDLTSDRTDDVDHLSFDSDRDDRPWYVRWMSPLFFLRPRKSRVPSLFGQSVDLDTSSSDPVSHDAAPDESEGVNALGRLERMLDSSANTPPTEAEIEALTRRRPRQL